MADKADLLKALKGLFVATKSIPSEDLDAIIDVTDLWNEAGGQHAVPTKEEIKTGPSESADGEGAFKMISQYSKPAPQSPAVDNYENFSKYLEGMTKAMKAQGQQIQALAAVVLKSEEAAPVVTNDFLAKAETRLKAAKAALRKADMADEDEKEEKEEAVEKAERALAAAKKLIVKAESENEDDMDDSVSEGCEKALSEHKKLVKALVKAKAELPVATPVVAAKAEDAHEKEGEALKEAEKEHEKETAKATPTVADPNRIEILETTVKGLMEHISGTSKSAPLPDLMKSFPIETVGEMIESAMDDGSMNTSEIMKAKDLHSRFQAARNGAYDGVKLQEEISAAPEKVRALFKAAA